MDLVKAKQCVEFFCKDFNFNCIVDVYNEYIHCKIPNVTLKGIDDNIGVSIGVTRNDTLNLEFIFDKIKNLEKAADAINYLNQKHYYTKAYVNPNGYFCVSYSTFMLYTPEDIRKIIFSIFNIVGDEQFINDLKRITKLTK